MDNKISYSKPFMIVEAFVPQQFCAGCTKPGNYYLTGFAEHTRLYLESNGTEGLQSNTGGDVYLSSGSIFFNDRYTKSTKKESNNTHWKYTLSPGDKLIILDGSGNNITSANTNITVFYSKSDPSTTNKNQS